jgi:hypothetical protein
MGSRSILFTVLMAVCCVTACGPKHDPLPVKKCGLVGTHARKLLGSRADSRVKMMKECKAANDEDRGCAMAADSAADLLRCS